MRTLPDIIKADLAAVVCGVAVPCSADRGHYYAGQGNSFWQLLHDSGLTSSRLTPEADDSLPELGLGLGLVDLVPADGNGGPIDVPSFIALMAEHRPRWVAFNGKKAGDAVARALGHTKPGLGEQDWAIVGARVFVLPSSSGANQRRDYDGRPDRLQWWAELAELVRTACGGQHSGTAISPRRSQSS